ncbi:hypothetical protein [Riemerella anatipestifer]|uniref:hypothetical protein n=1 Tax=Riemerella anatipestifer TaxID=34085 RepID=UPI0030EE8744
MRNKLVPLFLVVMSLHYAQNIAFSKLYGNNDPNNYYLGHYPVDGSDGLMINWYGGIKLRTSSGTGIQISGGNVGIGTDIPQSKLDINFVGEPKYIRFIESPNNASSMNARMRFGWYNETADLGMVRSGSASIEGLAININDLERVRFSADGNVGIGTSNPQSKLDINFGGEPKTIKFLETPNHAHSMNSMMRFSWYDNTSDIGIVRSDSYPIEALAIRFNQIETVRFTPEGNAMLQGKFEAKEIKVTTTPTADFVFDENYNLPKLSEVEKHIKEKKHLPEIPSAFQMEKEGVNVGEFQIKLLQKIEELTLYQIEQSKKIEKLEKENRIIRDLYHKMVKKVNNRNSYDK